MTSRSVPSSKRFPGAFPWLGYVGLGQILVVTLAITLAAHQLFWSSLFAEQSGLSTAIKEINAIERPLMQESQPVDRSWDGAKFESIPWQFANTKSGVDTYVKEVPGSKLLAFRGVSAMDVHISQVLGPFDNVTHSLEWVSMLKYIELLNFSNPTPFVDIVYQILSLPWPVSPRDILLRRHFHFNVTEKQVTILYYSINDDRKPESPGMIRAVSPHTMWRFTVLPPLNAAEKNSSQPSQQSAEIVIDRKSRLNPVTAIKRLWKAFSHQLGKHRKAINRKLGRPTVHQPVQPIEHSGTLQSQQCKADFIDSRTLVEVETVVDSKGSIPIWFINFMQRQWPSMTLSLFRKLAKEGLIQPHPAVLCW